MASKELSILITARDNASAALNKVRGSMSSLKGVTTGVGNAVSTFKSRVGSLLSGPLGLLGLGAGLAGITSAASSSIAEVRAFGEAVDRTASITGLSVEQASKLVSALQYVGVDGEQAIKTLGMAEKNLGNLGAQAKGTEKFYKQFGLSVTDANGKLIDANTLLLRSADYFNNKQIPAATKAAALAKIYGRNWQSLVEVFELGAPKIAAAEETAAKFGLTLTSSNMQQVLKLRDATRDWTTAFSGLKLQIGLQIIPALTDLSKAATNFLANGGRQQIVDFFKQLVVYGRNAASIITNDVIPVFKGIYNAWMSVPSEVRDLVIKGFAADKTIKFLFGFDPLKIVTTGLTTALSGGLSKLFTGSFFQRGGPGNPMYVVAEGGLGGGPGGVVGGAGGKLGTVLKFAGVALIGAAIGDVVGQYLNENGLKTPFGTIGGSVAPAKTFEANAFQQFTGSKQSAADMERAIKSIQDNLNPSDFGAKIALALDVNGVRSTLEQQLAVLQQNLPAVKAAELAINVAAAKNYAKVATVADSIRNSDIHTIAANNRVQQTVAATAASHLATLRSIGATSLAGVGATNRVHSKLSVLEGVDRGILAKKTSVSVHASIPVTVVNNLSINEWQRKVVATARSNANYGGFI